MASPYDEFQTPAKGADPYAEFQGTATAPAASPARTGIGGVVDKVQSFRQEHPYISGIASALIPGASGILDPTMEGGKGAIKQIGRDVYNQGIISPGLGPIPAAIAGATGITGKVNKYTEPSNPMQQVGAYGAQVAESAIPLERIGGMIPNLERAGEKIGNIRNQLANTPVNIESARPYANRAKELADARFYRPGAAEEVSARLAPGAPPSTFRQTTDLGMNLGELSASDKQAIKGPMSGQIKKLAGALSESNQATAEAAGLGKEYKQAMREYSIAKNIGNAKDIATKLAIKALVPGGIAGASYGGYKIARALGGD